MKKIGFLVLLVSIFSLIGTTTHAECKEVNFSNGSVCVDITKESTNSFKLKTDIERGYGALRCAILFSNNSYKEIPSCNGSFYVGNSTEQMIKLYIKFGSEYPYGWTDKPTTSNQRLFPQWMYDFRNGERSDEIDVDDSYGYGEVDNFYITSDDYYPTINQAVDLRIKARNDRNNTVSSYREQVKFNVYYRTSTSSYRTKTTSSTYYQLNSKYTNGYTFKYTDNGEARLNDFITFKKHYDYKIEVIDQDDNVSSYIIFDVTGIENDNNYIADNFSITTDNSNPSVNQRVDLGIRVRDSDGYTVSNYRGTVNFNVYYRLSSSSSWIKTTSSTYYELDTDYVDGYTFAYANNGNITLSDAIRFKRNYYYKVEVVDQSNRNILGYKQFDTYGSSNDDNDDYDTSNFSITTDNSTPSTNERVDLSIKARDADGYTITDYRGTVNFNVYYRSSSSSSWTKTTSSTYYELDPDYIDGYTFAYGDNGDVTLSNIIRFKKEYYYKVEIVDEDNNNIMGYRTFDTYGSLSSTNEEINDFYITTDDTTPSINQRINLSIKARDENGYTVTDYRGSIDFNIYYRSSPSSSWTKTTSSTYYELDYDYSNGYTFNYGDNGNANLTDAMRFKREYYYKVEVIDSDDNSILGYKLFEVGDTSYGSDVSGFSSTEIESIRNLYNSRDELIENYKSDYSRLRNSTTWINLSADLKLEMGRILNNSNLKEYDNYEEFMDALEYRYSYTLSTK